MNPQFWWYLSRAAGIVAWALAALAVLWGMALSTRALGARPRAPWLTDLHRHLGALTIAFTAVHLGALVADSYVHFGAADLLVPMASDWKPGPVTWGILAAWGLAAVEVTSLLGRRVPKVWWRRVHLLSYLVLLSSTVHLLTAGTDARNPVVVGAVVVVVAAPVFFEVYRRVGPGKAASVRSGSTRPGPARADASPAAGG